MAVFLLVGLGLCEHCGALLSIEGMPAEAMDAKWNCPKCKKELTHKSFGFELIGGKFEKKYWVGPECKWVNEKPKKDFKLGNWDILIEAPRMYFAY